MNKEIILAGAATLLLVGCAGSPPRNISQLESKIAEAESGDFGQCLRELSNASVELAKAKTVRDEAKRLWVNDREYQTGLAAATKADQHRRNAEQACSARVAMVETEVQDIGSDVTAVGGKVNKLEGDVTVVGGKVAELERVREIVRGVTFQLNSAVLTRQARTVLDIVANRLIRKPAKVEIAGYTSNTGSPEHNLRLSQQRAVAVRSYLIQRGVSPDNLTAKGYGMADPVASNVTEEGRRANKRVELHFFEK